jgi:hypothetical protein
MTRRFLCFALLSSVAACSPADPVGVARAGINGGQRDTQHTNVFAFVANDVDGMSDLELCSASLIAPNLLLTAHHCVADSPQMPVCGAAAFGTPYATSIFYATNQVSVAQATTYASVASVSVPPGGNDVCGFDLALVTLTANIDSSVVPLIPRIDERVVTGEGYTAVGYGEDAQDEGAVVRKELGGLAVTCPPGACGSEVASTEFMGSSGTCEGDSGGPALDAAGKVVGAV